MNARPKITGRTDGQHSRPHVAKHIPAAPPAPQKPIAQASVQHEDTENSVPTRHWVVGLLLALILGGGVYYLVVDKPAREWKAEYAVDLSITRTLPDPATMPDLKEVFKPETVARIINDGGGVRLHWKKQNGKKQQEGNLELLKPQADTNASERGEELRIAREKLAAFLKGFNAPPEPKNRVVVIAVDDTAGMDEKLAKQVSFNFENLDIDSMTAGGDTIRLLFQKITSTDFFEGKLVKLAAKEKLDADVVEKHLGGWLLKRRGPEKESSIATGLLNIAAEARINEDSHILIFSDGLENLPGTTASFEVGKFSNPEELSNEANWDELDKALTGPIRELKGSTPSLKGARVDWYAPPTEDNSRAKRIRAAMKYWRHFLELVHAGEVEMHF